MFGISKNHDKPPLKVIIVGAGKVGRTLVEQLSQEGNEITIIDKDAAKVDAALQGAVQIVKSELEKNG